MRTSAIFLAVTGAASVSAGSLFSAGGNQAVMDEKFKVPGENPLYFCSDPKDYSLKIESVELSPNPPVPYVFQYQRDKSCTLLLRKLDS